ncbi:hypothetical protein N0V86_004076 [Didymella sp. IMI 355093]|nr:hypothetical protein N0V86_004076 [Didymella sp. IMI 355093]
MTTIQSTTQLPGQELLVRSPTVDDTIPQDQVQAERRKLLASLRGKKLHIPNLKPMFDHWPSKTNPSVQPMRQDVQEWLKRSVDLWLFTWDDQFDDNGGSMWDDAGAAQICREQTIAFIRYTLGIDKDQPTVQNQIILNFEPIGVAIKGYYTLEKRHMFLKEIVYYIEMVAREQHLRLSRSIVSLEEFWQYRLGTSAVTVCLALNELSWEGMDMPTTFYADKDVQLLYRYTNTIISAVNDVLSVKKEIKQEAIDSLIPIMFYETGDIQTAVERVISFIKDEIKRMDETAAALLSKYSNAEAAVQEQVRLFIDGCKHHATGTVVWSLYTDRYGVRNADDGSGDIVMTL